MPPLPATRRLFIGLRPDAGVRHAIDVQRRAWYWPPGSRLTRPERLHLTLHFLGEVDAAREAALCGALRAMPPLPRMTLVLASPQAWANHVAVLVPDESPPLRALHQALGATLSLAGLLPSQRPWTPHVTLARNARAAGPPEAPLAIRWEVDAVHLVWSRLDPPACYETLMCCPLSH